MSEIIKLTVNMDGNAEASMAKVEAAIKRLNATPIAIKIDSSAVDKLSSKMLTVANNQARAAIAAEKTKEAQARAAAAAEKTKTAQAGVKIETQRTAQEQAKLSQQIEKTGQAIEKTGQAVQRTRQASAQAETVEQRRRLLAEQMSASYEKMAIAAERSGGTASSIPINTPMQNQVETLARYQTLSADTSANFLTAEQAARRFQAQGVSAFEKTLDAGSKTNSVVEKTGDSIGKLVGKVALWSAATTLIYGPIRAFREALTELQAVDDELVEVRKVTSASAAELEVLSDKAFKVGSTYGVDASDYMKSVAEMSRAGYDELSAALAELSVKTQLVGDVDAKTANQFLLSVDAAYKYNGSVAELSKVLDGANEIDNNYATSIEKIAEGLGKVAPIASQAHVGINELSAAIGTITAVTQRGGTEASTALRALFLNIMGDTKTEISDGVTWTAGEITGLRDVIKTYSKEAYAAAEATNSVINPMEAIGGLAQSMKDGLLSEQQLMSMVSDIGGKLRTSQLLALIQNWDMYKNMLADFGGAAGSADREVSNAMDSWTRKAAILKNTWTEFVRGTDVQSLIVKVIELGTAFIRVADNDFTHFIVKATAVTLGLFGLQKGFVALRNSAAISYIKNYVSGLAMMTAGLKGTSAATAAFSAVWKASPFAVIGIAVAAIFGIAAAVDHFNVTLEESSEKVKELDTQISEMTENSESEYTQLLAKAGDLTTEEQARLNVLEKQLENLRAQKALAQKETLDKYSQQNRGSYISPYSDERFYLSQTDYNQQRIDNFKALDPNDEDYESEAKAQIALIEKEFDALRELAGGREALTGILGEQYDAMELVLEGYYAQNDIEGSSIGSIAEQIDSLIGLQAELKGASKAVEDFNKALEGGEKGDSFKSYAEIYKGFMEDYSAGLVGSKKYQAAIQTMLGPDALEGLNYDWAKAGELLASDFWQGVFSAGGEDYGANFANALYEIADGNGDVIDENGRVVASFENVNGALDMEIESFEALAEQLGTTPEVISAITDALGAYSGELSYTAEEASAVLSTLDGVITELPGSIKQLDMTDFVSQLAKAGELGDAQISALVETIKSMDGFVLKNLPESVAATAAEARGAKADTDNAKNSVDELDKAKAEPKIDVDTTAADAAGIKVKNLMTELDALSATPTITALVKLGFGNFAEGTKNAPAGPALVNEEAPEIIKRGDEAFIAGNGLPTIVDLEAGDVVYTGEQSKQILGGRGFSGTVGAFSNGASISGIPLTEGEKSDSAPKELPARASNAKTSNAEKDAKDALDELKKQLDELFADAEHKIFLLSKKVGNAPEIMDAYRKMMDEAHAQADKYRDMGEDENSDYIQDLQKQWWGYYESIEKAQKELWSELEAAVEKELEAARDARDLELGALEEQKKALEEARKIEDDRLSLEEKKLAVMEAQEKLITASSERDVRMLKNGVWQWVADEKTVRDAREALDDAQKDLDKYQAELAYKAAVDEIEARRDAINAAYDALEENWKAITESLETPTREISDILADIAENGTPNMKAQIERVNELLGSLSNYIAAATNSKAGGSASGGGGLASKDYSSDTTDYAALMENSASEAEFNYWAGQRDSKIEAQDIDLAGNGWATNEDIYNAWKGGKTFDRGGEAGGKGIILKDTADSEIMLPPELAKKVISPTSSAQFEQFARSLGVMFGAAARYPSSMQKNTSSATDSHDNYYSINGVPISTQQANALTISQLARALSPLSLHTDRGM